MDKIETVRLLRLAHDEIITLRRRNTELEPKAHAYETLAIVARLSAPKENLSFAEDVAWRLKEAVESLSEEIARDTASDRP